MINANVTVWGLRGRKAGLVTVSCRSWEGFCEMMYILFIREKQELHNGKSGSWVDAGGGEGMEA